MIGRCLILFTVLVFGGEYALAAELQAPGTFGSLQNAIHAAQSGDTVIIAPGEYNENLTLKNGVSLKAQESGKSIIHAAVKGIPALRCDDCYYNDLSGLVLTGPTDTVLLINRSTVQVQDCTVSGGVYGLVLARGGSSTVRNCTVADNSRVGIFVLGGITTPKVENCTSTRNGFAGIFIAERAQGEYKTNTCSENEFGMIVSRDVSVMACGNVFLKNRGAGTYLDGRCTLLKNSDRNHYQENGAISPQEILSYFDQRQFDLLETIANRLRETKKLTRIGYHELSSVYTIYKDCQYYQETAFWDTMKAWEAQYPKSLTRRIMLAGAYWKFAQQEKEKDKYDPEKYNRNVKMAYEVFQEVVKENPPDPEIYLIGMGICEENPTLTKSTGSAFWDAISHVRSTLNEKNPDYEKWLAAGLQCDPNSLSLCKKGMDAGDFCADAPFVKKWVPQNSGESADILYARLSTKLLIYPNYVHRLADYGFDWARIKRGIEALLNRYPESWLDRHEMCRLACAYNDREIAAKLFSGCMENSGGYPWDNQYQYDGWKKWATQNGPLPETPAIFGDVVIDYIDEVRNYLDHGGNINQLNDNGYSLLTTALWVSNDEIVQLLLDRGCDVNAMASRDMIPLDLAVWNNDEDMVRNLLRHKADVNLVKSDGWSPFQVALKNKNEALARILLEAGTDPNRPMPFASTPLAFALKSKQNDLARMLVDRGADVNAKGVDGEIPLLYAAAQGDISLCTLLLDRGANPRNKNRKGRSPIHSAARNGKLDTLKFLIEKGCGTPDDRCPDGWTVLHSAIDGKSREVLDFLLEHIPAPFLNQVTATEYIPVLHYAAKVEYLEGVERLLASKADVNLRDQTGKTPLAYALNTKNEPIITLLRSHGATE